MIEFDYGISWQRQDDLIADWLEGLYVGESTPEQTPKGGHTQEGQLPKPDEALLGGARVAQK